MSRRLVGAFARVCGLVGPLRGQVSCEGTRKMETCPGNYDLSLPPQVLNSTKLQSTVASAKFTLPVRTSSFIIDVFYMYQHSSLSLPSPLLPSSLPSSQLLFSSLPPLLLSSFSSFLSLSSFSFLPSFSSFLSLSSSPSLPSLSSPPSFPPLLPPPSPTLLYLPAE